MIVVDIETYDPGLKWCGAGSAGGQLIGVGLHDETGSVWVRPDDPRLRDWLASDDPKCFHNGVYDLWWLEGLCGFKVNGVIHDTMTREYLLDAYAGRRGDGYGLDACAKRHRLPGKNKTETIDYWWTSHGGKGKAVSNLDKIPFDVIGEYCLQDCKATWDLFNAQTLPLTQQGLDYAYDIECRIYPLLMMMKKNGMRVDEKKRAALEIELEQRFETGFRKLQSEYPFLDSLNKATQLEQIWNLNDIPVVRTATNKPSFNKDALAAAVQAGFPIAKEIHELRTIEKVLSTFISSYPDYMDCDKYIHSTFYPALRDEGGTVTGRFSARDPNMQNIPADSDRYGPEVRSLFIPEDDHILLAFDYKQIEYMVFMHYCTQYITDINLLQKAKELQQRIWDDAKIDFHAMVGSMMDLDTSEHDARKVAKQLNFGVLYGLGIKSLAERFGRTEFQARVMMNQYNAAVPFIRATMDEIMKKVRTDGYVPTISGRRQRRHPEGKDYTAVNYLCQGTASDILKKGLIDSYEAGVFDVLKLHATIHDENVASAPLTKAGYEASVELARYMSAAYELAVPIRVDTECGPDWGHCNMKNWEQYKSTFFA